MPQFLVSIEIVEDQITPKIGDRENWFFRPYRLALKDWLESVKDDASDRAPKDLGDLSDLRTYLTPDGEGLPETGGVQATVPYFWFVHGAFRVPSAPRRRTRPHMPPASASLVEWADRHGINPWALRYSIAAKGTPIVPFISEAVDAKIPALDIAIAKAAAEMQRLWSQ